MNAQDSTFAFNHITGDARQSVAKVAIQIPSTSGKLSGTSKRSSLKVVS